MTDIRILYEDDQIILVDKPAGSPTHQLKPDETGTVVNFLIDHVPHIKGVGTSILMSGIAHRLDTDTSGIVLAAKNNESFQEIRSQFKEQVIYKGYITLVHGIFKGPNTISSFIGPHPRKKKKVMVYQNPDRKTRSAETEILERNCYGDYTWLTLRIKTGVRHQIRAHLSSLGFPIVGDRLYQNVGMRKRDQLGLNRQFLHAYRIGFYHPKSKDWVVFESKLPAELEGALVRLRHEKS